MNVCSVFKDRQSPLEDMLCCKVISGKDGSDESATNTIRAHFMNVYDVMLDGLVDSSDLLDFVSHLIPFGYPGLMTWLAIVRRL